MPAIRTPTDHRVGEDFRVRPANRDAPLGVAAQQQHHDNVGGRPIRATITDVSPGTSGAVSDAIDCLVMT